MSERLRTLLAAYKGGELSEDDVLAEVARAPYEAFTIGRFDADREARVGVPEAILAEGKQPEAVAEIMKEYASQGRQIVATRVGDDVLAALGGDVLAGFHHDPVGRVLATKPPEIDASRPEVLVVSAGTLDVPVAREAASTSELLGNPTSVLFDVGVAGLNRLVPELPRIEAAGILIVVAGMDGALPSVLGGVSRRPMIAVPTSVGYGSAFGGLAPLLTMLNSCAPGSSVVNIDNGFGAAVMATKIAQLAVSHGARG
jgi:hypothetical protein